MADNKTTNRDQPPRKPKNAPPGWRVEGGPPETSGDAGRRRPPGGPRFWWILVAALALNWIVFQIIAPNEPNRITIPYTEFLKQVDSGNVEKISSLGDRITGNVRNEITDGDGKQRAKGFRTVRPSYVVNDDLQKRLEAKNVLDTAKSLDEPRPFWQTLLAGFGPAILLILLFVWFFKRAAGGAGGGGGILGVGKSRAKRYEANDQRTTFADVAGIDEVKLELSEVVDFLKHPEKYLKLGGTIPRGVLLYGPPGTGKTLLARAVAGEAGVPFFSLSASEFVEMFVGVGASRVRDLFKQDKEAAPAIIFIDELDAIGRSRGSGAMGGHEEREQTLNQILTEMDGFSGAEGVIVLAATNRPEILDAALLRPGRFDRRVAVNSPDQAGRLAILRVHSRHMPLADDVDLEGLASSSPGMVGADLKNLANEAALMAARRSHERVELADFTDALEKILLGAERKIMLSKDERERTAYHESGHALLGMLQPGADPVRKISIIPRGRALGVTFQSPSADRYGYDADYLRGRIVGALGGRAAEKIVYGDVTTGAESDLETVTRIAKQMVGRWGMSEAIGPVSVLPGPNDEPFLLPGTGPGGPSAHTLELIDSEVRKIVDECYQKALTQITQNRDKLEALAKALLDRETLDEADAYAVAGFPRPPRPELLDSAIPDASDATKGAPAASA
jgi:cell division protease FtsH